MSVTHPPIRMTEENVDAAAEWRFNCGPAALCAVLGKTPEEIRPDLLDFEDKGYTNPTLMLGILKGLRVPHRIAWRERDPALSPSPSFGLVRVQWGGPWTEPGVPERVRYRHSHWIAARKSDRGPGTVIFDINALAQGWILSTVWSDELVPWLLKQCEPKANGKWWPTHLIEITPGGTAA